MRNVRSISFLLLIALPLAVYFNSLDNTFVYDDVFTITDNYFIRDWGNLSSFLTEDYFKNTGEVTYRPLVTLSYFIDYSIWHLNPVGYHLTNVVLHVFTVLLVYLLIFHIVKNCIIAFLTGVLFAVHPLLAETVNGISYREDILTTAFFLCTVLLYIRSNRRNSRFIYLYPLSLSSYLLALCSKEMAITLPFIIIIFDWIFSGVHRIKKNVLRYYLGFVLASTFYLFLRFVWFHNSVETQLTYPDNSFVINLLTMPKVFCSYIKLLFLPAHLNADYIVSGTRTPLAAAFILSIIFLGVLGIIFMKLYDHSRLIFFFLLWFVVTLVPALNIIPIANIMAERYLYLPSVGFCLVLSCIMHGMWRKLCAVMPGNQSSAASNSGNDRQPQRLNNLFKATVLSCIVLVPVVLYSLATIKRNKVWKNPFVFWSETVQASPRSSRGHSNLGMMYYLENKTDLAIREFQTALSIEKDPEYHHNLGMAYQQKGMQEEALEEYYRVLAVNPDSAITYNNMGNILVSRGNIDGGILKFKKAIELKRKYYDAHFNLGIAYFRKKELEASMNEFKLAIQYEPDHASAHSCLGTVYANKGLYDQAIREYEETLRLDPKYSAAYKNLGLIYMNYKKDFGNALYHFNKFLQSQPMGDDAAIVKKAIEELQMSRSGN
ncbi:MAG: tetratricopeptide repeat protein [Candidatus Brocadiaceae bacterium]|nr:tetratricopeptide repeat protein [Candidatus Brocadiaceae bacterium]